jgi:hypothetical protein
MELGPGTGKAWGSTMKVRISLEYKVEDENPELEQLAGKLIRAEADALVEAVRRKLSAAGAEVTSLRADYE